jgi:hypothetical protein
MAVAAFENLSPPNKSAIFSLIAGTYKIYKAPGDFVSVKASSALEAIKNSGCDSIYRVERDSLDKNYVLAPNKATELLLGAEKPAESAAAAPAAEPPKA